MKDSLDAYIKSVGWLRWLFLTKDGQVVIAQFPNAPLLIGFLADAVAFATKGQAHLISNVVSQVAFMIWALMEIGWGVNPFRRILGGLVFALVAFGVVKSFG